MTRTIDPSSHMRHSAPHRQLDKRRAAVDGRELIADLFAESQMKIQTNVKAGGGLLDIDVDINVDLDVNLFGGCKKTKTRC
jgi:hypothetical protein